MAQNIYELRDLILKQSNKRVFSYSDLAHMLNINLKTLRVIVFRLKQKKLVNIMYDKIIFDNDELIVSTQLVEPSYISLKSALYLNNIILQVPFINEIVTPKNTYSFDKYKYHKLNPLLFFGFHREKYKDSYFYVAESEKAIIDGLYLHKISESFVVDNLKNLNKKKLLFFARKVYDTKVKGTKKIYNYIKELIENK